MTRPSKHAVMEALADVIFSAKDAKHRTQAELDATSLRNRVIKDDLARLVSLHELELAVAKQLEDAARAKRKARESLPRVHAALRSALRTPEEFTGEAEAWRAFEETVWRRS
jgi:hypothetical protein